MKYFARLLFLIFFCKLALYHTFVIPPKYIPSKPLFKVEQFKRTISTKIYKKYGLNQKGPRIRIGDKISKMSLWYESDRTFDIKQARKLIIEVVPFVIQEINQSKELRPYLENYPLDQNDLYLSITFNANPNTHKEKTGVVIFSKGNVIYANDQFSDKEPFELTKKVAF